MSDHLAALRSPRRPDRPRTPRSASPSTAASYQGTPATPWPPRCSPTASTRSRPASSSAGRAASWPRAPRTPTRWSRSRQPFPEPMLPATTVELYDGLVAVACPVRAGSPDRRTPPRYDAVHAHCDVLVVGAGPAGLAAALTAARAGARVILVDDQPEPAARCWARPERDRRRPGAGLGRGAVAELAPSPTSPSSSGPRPSATTTTASSSPSRSAPTTSDWTHRPTSPASGSGASGRGTSWSPPAPTSARSSSPATTSRASCSPRRPGPTCTATAWSRGARWWSSRTDDSAYAAAVDLADAGATVGADCCGPRAVRPSVNTTTSRPARTP